MRIALPSDDRQHLASHTGRAREFVVFELNETNASEIDARPNPRWGNHQRHQEHGHAHQHDQQNHVHDDMISVLADCQAVVALGMGPRLQAEFREHGIDVFFTRDLDLHRVANAMVSGLLQGQGEENSCHKDTSRP